MLCTQVSLLITPFLTNTNVQRVREILWLPMVNKPVDTTRHNKINQNHLDRQTLVVVQEQCVIVPSRNGGFDTASAQSLQFSSIYEDKICFIILEAFSRDITICFCNDITKERITGFSGTSSSAPHPLNIQERCITQSRKASAFCALLLFEAPARYNRLIQIIQIYLHYNEIYDILPLIFAR